MLIAAALYPRAWRERYGAEFRALLDDLTPSLRDFWNVLGGALRMRITSEAAGKLAGGMALAGAFLAAFLTYRAPALYESRTSVQMAPGAQANAVDRASVRLIEVNQVVINRNTIEDLIREFDLYKAERRRVPMDEIVTQMRERDLHFTWANSRPVTLSISFAYPDRAKAQAVLRELLAKMADESDRLDRFRERLWPKYFSTAPPADAAERFVVLRPPTIPEEAGRPWLLSNILMGVCAGALLGLLATAFMRRPKWTLAMAACGIGAGVLALVPSYWISNQWRSTAMLRLSPAILLPESEAHQRPGMAARLGELKGAMLSDDRLRKMVATPEALRDFTIAPVRLPGEPETAATVFAISFTYPNRELAQRGVVYAITALMERNIQAARARQAGYTLEVLDPPSDPQEPTGPLRNYFLLGGIAAGLLLGWLILPRRIASPAGPQPA